MANLIVDTIRGQSNEYLCYRQINLNVYNFYNLINVNCNFCYTSDALLNLPKFKLLCQFKYMYVRIIVWFFFCLFQFFILDWQNMSQLTNDDVLENIWVDAGDEKHIEILFSDSEFDSDNYVVEDGESEKDMAR